ncbi:MAG: flap endonuclease-1 [Candidatus Diapherotrites archaeon]|nr:flap endonuclease-1 [Candidatus Diapherotrites archaeon]
MGTPIGEILERAPLDWGALDGKKIAVDAYNVLYQFLSSIRGEDGSPLMDAQGRVTSHLSGLFYRTNQWVQKGMRPLFVFDGKPHELKSKTLSERHAIRTHAFEEHKKAVESGDLEKARLWGSRALKLTPEMIESAKELVSFMGLPVIHAPSEGEAQMALLVSKGDAFAGASQDYDALLFGCPRVIRNLAVTGKRKAPGKNFYVDVEPELLELGKVLSALSISREKLVWLALLVGTDFNEKFPKVGPKTALKLVQKHDSFESIAEAVGFVPNFDYREVQGIFLKPVQSLEYSTQFRPPDREKILEFLVEEHSFSRERVEGTLDKLVSKLNEKGAQSSLSAWG